MAQTRLPTRSSSDYEIINRRLEILTFDRTAFELFDNDGQIGHARSSCIELGTAIKLIPSTALLSTIEVYADTLITEQPVTLSARADSLIIFARDIVVSSEIVINISSDVLIRFYCSGACCPFNVRINSPTKSRVVSVDLPYDAQAYDLDVSGRGIVTSAVRFPPADRFDAPTVYDRILDSGLRNPAYNDKLNEHLPTLLRYQLLLAASWQQKDPASAFDLGTFVAKIAQGIPKAVQYYAQGLTYAAVTGVCTKFSSTVLTTKAASSPDQVVSQVPIVKLHSIKDIVDAHLSAANAFDVAYRDFKSMEMNSANVILMANTTLEASEDADDMYAFLAATTKARFDSACKSLEQAKSTMQSLEKEIPDAQQAFEDGIKAWKTKNIAEVVVKGLVAVGMIVGSLAAACVAPPAGAGAIAGAVEVPEVAAEAAEGVKTVEQIVSTFDKLKNLFNKLKPALEKIQGLVDTIQNVLALMAKMKSVGDADDGSLKALTVPVEPGDDLINLAADWDEFGTEMATLYDPIKSEGIGGAGEFFLLVAKLVIRGKAMLTAQQAVTTTGDAYSTVLSQQIVSNRATARMRAAIPRIQGDPIVLGLLKQSMMEKLLYIRTSIVLDFMQYMHAYQWYTLAPLQGLRLDPLKDIGDFYDDTAKVQAAVMTADVKLLTQQRSFHFSAKASDRSAPASRARPATLGLVLGGSQVQAIKGRKPSAFSIDPTLHCFQNIFRVRMASFKLLLVGVEGYVSTRIVLGEQMADLMPHPTIQGSDQIADSLLNDGSRMVHFSVSSTTLGYSYEDGTQMVKPVLDGQLGGAALPPSPFRSWHVEIDDASADLSMLTDIRLEIVCDVCLI